MAAAVLAVPDLEGIVSQEQPYLLAERQGAGEVGEELFYARPSLFVQG